MILDSRFSMEEIRKKIRPASARRRLKAVVYGPPGSGKTVLLSTLPRVLLIDFEDGEVSLQGWEQHPRYDGGEIFHCTDWRDVDEAYYYLLHKTNPDGSPYFQSVGVDTVSTLHDEALTWVRGGKKIDREKLLTQASQSEMDFRPYNASGRMVDEILSKLNGLVDRFNVVYAGHQRVEAAEKRERGTDAEITLELPRGIRGEVFKGVDIIGYLEGSMDRATKLVEGKQVREEVWRSTLTIGPGGSYRAKNRLAGPYLPPEKRLPAVIKQPTFRKILKYLDTDS